MRAPLCLVLVGLLAGCSEGGSDAGEGVDHDGSGASSSAGVEPSHTIQMGAVNAAESMQTHEFAVDAGHARLAVALVMLEGGSGSLAMNVTAPGGRWERVTTGPFLYVFPGTRSTASFADPEEGPWEAAVNMGGNGPMVRYEVHFCADSAADPGPQGNLACHRDY